MAIPLYRVRLRPLQAALRSTSRPMPNRIWPDGARGKVGVLSRVVSGVAQLYGLTSWSAVEAGSRQRVARAAENGRDWMGVASYFMVSSDQNDC